MSTRAVVHLGNMNVHQVDNVAGIDVIDGVIILGLDNGDRYYPFGSIEYVEIIREEE